MMLLCLLLVEVGLWSTDICRNGQGGQQGRRVVYGSDELVSPAEFIAELDKLGR